jgi:hypothetical protein
MRRSRCSKDAGKGDATKVDKSKTAKAAGGRQAAAGADPERAPTLTAEQIAGTSDANIERIKKELNLTPEQEKHWNVNRAMHYLGNNGADRLLRIAQAQRDPPDDIIEQMRNEAHLNDRAVDQRNVHAADPLFISLTTSRSRCSSMKWCG